MLSFRDSLFGFLDVPRPWGEHFTDSPEIDVVWKAVGKQFLLFLKESLAQSQLPMVSKIPCKNDVETKCCLLNNRQSHFNSRLFVFAALVR